MLKLSVTAALAYLNPASMVQPTKHVPNLGHVVIVRKDTLVVAYQSLPGGALSGGRLTDR